MAFEDDLEQLEILKASTKFDEFVLAQILHQKGSAKIETIRLEFNRSVVTATATRAARREIRRLVGRPIRGMRMFRRSAEIDRIATELVGRWYQHKGRPLSKKEIRSEARQLAALVEQLIQRLKLN